jgi:hypothetical protein
MTGGGATDTAGVIWGGSEAASFFWGSRFFGGGSALGPRGGATGFVCFGGSLGGGKLALGAGVPASTLEPILLLGPPRDRNIATASTMADPSNADNGTRRWFLGSRECRGETESSSREPDFDGSETSRGMGKIRYCAPSALRACIWTAAHSCELGSWASLILPALTAPWNGSPATKLS